METTKPKSRMTATEIWRNVTCVLFLVLLLGTSGFLFLTRWAEREMTTVKCYWNNGNLRFSTIRGGVVITHLEGFTARGAQVGAALKEPKFILDSAPAVVTADEYAHLEWRQENGQLSPGPEFGSEITGLYVRLQRSEFHDPQTRE